MANEPYLTRAQYEAQRQREREQVAEQQRLNEAHRQRLQASWDAAVAEQQRKHPTLSGVDWNALSQQDRQYADQRDAEAQQQQAQASGNAPLDRWREYLRTLPPVDRRERQRRWQDYRAANSTAAERQGWSKNEPEEWFEYQS